MEEKRVMPIKRYKPEQIVTMLRQIEVSIANGKTPPQACKEAEITMQTFYRWRKEYGGLKMDQAKWLKEPEKENGKLKRLVAELALSGRSPGAEVCPHVHPRSTDSRCPALPSQCPIWRGHHCSLHRSQRNSRQ